MMFLTYNFSVISLKRRSWLRIEEDIDASVKAMLNAALIDCNMMTSGDELLIKKGIEVVRFWDDDDVE